MGKKGFTFIELVITIAIISILASMVIPLSKTSVKRSKEMELRYDLRAMRNALDAYKTAWDNDKIKKNIGESGYPPDLASLVSGVDDASSPEAGKKIRFLRRIPRDPMNPDADLAPEKTWGLRSYRSDPDDPKEGDDIFDVYSKSTETALDGTAYNTW
ncbi:MAG: type II secretion system protein [Deltaproteobacteria bacterium]|nr:type II secretion system protein [Deltaproteobacteria bacterium]